MAHKNKRGDVRGIFESGKRVSFPAGCVGDALMIVFRRWMMGFSFLWCFSFSGQASDLEQEGTRPPSYLALRGISLEDPQTWPPVQEISLPSEQKVHALRFDFCPEETGYSVFLEGPAFSDEILTLAEGKVPLGASVTLHQTYVIEGQPTFIHCTLGSPAEKQGKMRIHTVSSPYTIVFLTNPHRLSLEIGEEGDPSLFGILESREGSLFVGMDHYAPLHPQFQMLPPDDAPSFSFQAIDNIQGGIYAPHGKIVLSATQGSIFNGRAVLAEGSVTTQVPFHYLDGGSINTTGQVTHRFYTGGNGSFMHCKDELQLFAHTIQNPYNVLSSERLDIWLGYFESTLQHRGFLKGRNLWVGARSFDIRQETTYCEERRGYHYPPGSFIKYRSHALAIPRFIPVSDTYPTADFFGDLYWCCDDLYTNHPQSWSAVFRYKGKEYLSNYDRTGPMKIHVDRQ